MKWVSFIGVTNVSQKKKTYRFHLQGIIVQFVRWGCYTWRMSSETENVECPVGASLCKALLVCCCVTKAKDIIEYKIGCMGCSLWNQRFNISIY
jgi:hypothetical protein